MDDASAARGRNVLFLVSSLTIGGSERKIVRLANALAGEGHRVVLAYLNDPATLLAELDPAARAVHLRRKGKFSAGALGRLAGALRENRIDTLVSVNLYATLYAGLLAKFSRRLGHVRFIASVNTTVFGNARSERRMLLYRMLLRSMDLVIFGAESQRALWRRNYLGRNAPAAGVLYNGVDTAHFRRDQVAPWRAPHWPSSRIVIGSVGALRPEKSYDHLIRAVWQLQRCGLDVGAVIVGDGELAPALRRLIAELGLEDRVRLAGAVRDVRPYLAGFDIFAVTSTAVETFSNAALEALAMNCPVVSSDIGGMPEMLAAGGGVTYETGNLPALVQALRELVLSAPQRAALAQQARRVVLQRFSLEAMVASFRQLAWTQDEPQLRNEQPIARARHGHGR